MADHLKTRSAKESGMLPPNKRQTSDKEMPSCETRVPLVADFKNRCFISACKRAHAHFHTIGPALEQQQTRTAVRLSQMEDARLEFEEVLLDLKERQTDPCLPETNKDINKSKQYRAPACTSAWKVDAPITLANQVFKADTKTVSGSCVCEQAFYQGCIRKQ